MNLYPCDLKVSSWTQNSDPAVEIFASWSRALTGARVENKLVIFGEMARDAASYVAAQRQQAVDDLWHIADDIGLVTEIGTSLVQLALCNAFDGDCAVTAVLQRQAYNYKYEGLSSTFADPCREADRAFRKQQSQQPSAKQDRLPKSTLDAIDWVRSLKDEHRLSSFLKGRSEEELQKIERYFIWKHQHGNN